MGELTKERKAILEAALFDRARISGHLESADGLVPAEAWIVRGRRKLKVSPKDIDALYRADLLDLTWHGLGNWDGRISMLGRQALRPTTSSNGGDDA